MGWKYVMLEVSFGETKMLFPIIFSDKMVHIEIATVAKLCGPLEGRPTKVISAGNIEHLEISGLGGGSETLALKSRKTDREVIENYSYDHGIDMT